MTVNDIRNYFKSELESQRFTTDKTGQKTIELFGASFIADEPAIVGTPSTEYIQRELDWYKSQSTNINDIYGDSKPAPQAWQYSADKHGNINSNYGYLIYNDKFYNQYKNVLNELINSPDGRRATMVYNRPSIWVEFNENGKSDFICTNAVTYYIRDNKLHSVVQMRSNDVVFGYKNDYAWQRDVMVQLINDILTETTLNGDSVDLELGNLYWQVQNLHVYERHFHLVEEM